MVAGDGLRQDLRVVVHRRVVLGMRRVGVLDRGIITVDANPLHRAALGHLILADDGDVVLRLAGHHARVAARAGVQINRHAPLVLRVQRRVAVEGNVRRDVGVHAHHRHVRTAALEAEPGFLLISVDGQLAHEVAAFHRLMLLGDDDLVRFARSG